MSLEIFLRGNVFWVRGRPADSNEYIRASLGTSDEAIAQAACREIEGAARKRRILGADAPKPEDELTFQACVMLYDAPARDADYLKPITRRLGKKLVKEITPQFVRRLAKEMLPTAAVDTWQRQVVTPIRAVINNAHELGKCPPIRIKAFDRDERIRQDRMRGKESRVPKRPGSWPWLNAFMANATPRDGALAHFMFRHGVRVGAAIGLDRRTDLDLGAGTVRLPPTKGHDAVLVHLDPEEVVMIANLPLPYRGEARFRVFGISGGRSGALYRRWKAACAAAGIEYLSPHAAGRHGFATEMIVRQGIDAATVAEDRWSSPAVMLKTYSHPIDSAAKVRDAFAAGREASRTPAVQKENRDGAKTMPRNRKAASLPRPC